MSDSTIDLVDLSARIVSAYVAHNHVTPGELTGLIGGTHAALGSLNGKPAAAAPAPLVPAVSIRKSITPDAIICLEDGKAFKSLKRHLGASYGLSPDQYRAKWGLPADYPMVAPAYAEARSKLARSFGLGRQGKAAVPPAPAAQAKRGRKPKASA